MSRSSAPNGQRGQTEPLAALVAVSALIVGIGLYGLYLTDTLPGTTDRTTEETAVTRIKGDIETDGVVRSYGHDELEDLIETASLPHGRNVYVQVTVVDDGRETVVADALFGTDGQPNRDPLESGELEGPPAEAGVATRPIAVATRPGAVRGGTLLVGVWNG
ncbi:hypothetical protein CP556_11720 [Natrinema sp. CBA1119]|uniref:DUF7285 family protein n=1 Tax=Natrinema sp. CBA1119 TaxID=1608465 RepID=UPI000BF59C0E|nr:hypothetical protein [Natrinema sp. CBA1119]PGF16719.1 hypothetical protein CP556_11720 [Natrinema sp. CBA1119]